MIKNKINYDSTFISWCDGILNTNKLIIKYSVVNDEKLSFIVEMIILQVYDEYDKETNCFKLKYGLIKYCNSRAKNRKGTERVYNLLSPSPTPIVCVQNSDDRYITNEYKRIKKANEKDIINNILVL